MQYLELPRIHVAVVLILFLLASASYSLPTAAPENGQETANTSVTTTTPPALNSSAQEVENELKAGSLNAGAAHHFPHCHRKRKNFTISYPGNEPGLVCKDGREPFPYCEGGCRSLTRVIQSPPFVESVCNCCSFLDAEVRKRTVDFKCTDSKGNEVTKKVLMYFPRITDCTCVRCGQQPNVNIK
uniref:CTCK domain-containing protein n=1 Tax=Amphimedon queenslandica TaxID=400682 RepID=A0A1X7UPC7_AMPQE